MGAPLVLATAAVVVAATAATVTAVAAAAQTVVAATAEQQDEDDDPPAAITTETIVTHNEYLQDFLSGIAAHSKIFRSIKKVRGIDSAYPERYNENKFQFIEGTSIESVGNAFMHSKSGTDKSVPYES